MISRNVFSKAWSSPGAFAFLLAGILCLIPLAARAQVNKVAGAAAEAALSPIAKEAAEKASAELLGQATAEAARQTVVESAKVVDAQLAKAANRYGETVLAMARRVPEASGALAARAPQLVPLVEKLGDDILRLEARAPGFGELAGVAFGKEDIPRLLKLPDHEMKSVIVMATHATDPRAARLLLEGAEKGGRSFIEKLSARQIVAGGLSVAAVLAAYRAAGIVETSPDAVINGAVRLGQTLLSPFSYIGAALLAAWGGLAVWRWHLRAARGIAS